MFYVWKIVTFVWQMNKTEKKKHAMKAGLGETQSPFIKRLVRNTILKWRSEQSKHVNHIQISRFNHMTWNVVFFFFSFYRVKFWCCGHSCRCLFNSAWHGLYKHNCTNIINKNWMHANDDICYSLRSLAANLLKFNIIAKPLIGC